MSLPNHALALFIVNCMMLLVGFFGLAVSEDPGESRFIIVSTPLNLYFLWFVNAVRQALKSTEPSPRLATHATVWMVLAGLATAGGGLALLGILFDPYQTTSTDAAETLLMTFTMVWVLWFARQARPFLWGERSL